MINRNSLYCLFVFQMGKNNGPGGKNRRKGKSNNLNGKRPMIWREDGQEYAIVIKILGDCRCEVQCQDQSTRIAHIRGKMQKRVWISTGDWVLLGLREFEEQKADIIHKYTADEVKMLQNSGEWSLLSQEETTETNADILMLQEDEGEVDVTNI